MPSASRKTRGPAAASEAAPTRLVRIPYETYELLKRAAEQNGRHMNHQLGVIVEEWVEAEEFIKAERRRLLREARRQVRRDEREAG